MSSFPGKRGESQRTT